MVKLSVTVSQSYQNGKAIYNKQINSQSIIPEYNIVSHSYRNGKAICNKQSVNHTGMVKLSVTVSQSYLNGKAICNSQSIIPEW